MSAATHIYKKSYISTSSSGGCAGGRGCGVVGKGGGRSRGWGAGRVGFGRCAGGGRGSDWITAQDPRGFTIPCLKTIACRGGDYGGARCVCTHAMLSECVVACVGSFQFTVHDLCNRSQYDT